MRARSTRNLAVLTWALSLGGCRESSAQAEPAPRPPRSPVWSGPAECAEWVGRGRRLPRRPGEARIGSWNVRWFPDGDRAEAGTDVTWLACAIAYLDVDVLAVQEFKATPRARLAAEDLCAQLGRATGQTWRYRLDDCPGRGSQHVGFVWNEGRVKVADFQTLPSLNPHGGACEGQLRPGFAGYFGFAGGLDAHIVSLHLKSSTDQRSFDLRRRSWQGFAAATAELARQNPDPDWILAGDFNSMGCKGCPSKVSADEERRELGRALEQVGVRLLPANARLTESSRGGALLDHIAVSRASREVPGSAVVAVHGYCTEPGRRARDGSPARAALSDHCPIVLDLVDRDLD